MGFFDRFKAPDLNDGLTRFRETPGAVLLDVREADEYAQKLHERQDWYYNNH